MLFDAGTTFACGPFFPNTLLDRGDNALLAAPIANFYLQMRRLEPRAVPFASVPAAQGYAVQTEEAEIADLRTALARRNASPIALEDIVWAQEAEREKVVEYLTLLKRWDQERGWDWVGGQYTRLPAKRPRPEIAPLNLHPATGIPEEFVLYFRGAIAWHSEKTNDARAAWEELLKLPAGERQFRSTWAAYMLGRSWQEENPEKAIEYFQLTRKFASEGSADTIGLAAASLGREAKGHLDREEYAKAINLYLDQMYSGTKDADLSLRLTASEVCNKHWEALPKLASDPGARRVIMAYIISSRRPEQIGMDLYGPPGTSNNVPAGFVVRSWLEAAERAGVKDVESAEELALAAYNSDNCEFAERWLKLAPGTPTAKWLQAKLLLRAGKLDAAATRLAEVAKLFPLDASETNHSSPPGLKDILTVQGSLYWNTEVPAANQVLGELGTLQLSRREYAQALDSLLRSGHWADAAYVAERVLTVDELKTYVDGHWPQPSSPQTKDFSVLLWSPYLDQCGEIRYLLARRLSRAARYTDARTYYPEDCLNDFDNLICNLRMGWDANEPATTRARALFEAAKITRHEGMELLGTEVEPDWTIHGGDFDDGASVAERASKDSKQMVKASEDEIKRAQEHDVEPAYRFHYRYLAAGMGWEAAKLMPNNNDETAVMLCLAGTWLKDSDPVSADFFYKALVRRCRKTALGDEADRIRWFPAIDKDGNFSPWKPPVLQCSIWGKYQTAAGPVGGYNYTLARGNSLQDVVDNARTNLNLTITVQDLMKANPFIVHPAKVYAGELVFVPAPPPTNSPSNIGR
jgi:tetratricopeptide (TPR) repeat protein